MKKNVRLILDLLHRFVEGPFFSKQKFMAFFRYIGCVFSLVVEKVRGVDYTMVYYTKDESDNSHSSYTKVPRKIMKRIFRELPKDKSKLGFLDVGCGKGYAVKLAAKEGFGKSGGVEYSKRLYEVCCSNLARERVVHTEVYNEDAAKFEKYGEFDVFFLNNPFDETIIAPVAEKIYKAHGGRKCWIFYLNPKDEKRTTAIKKAGFVLEKQIRDCFEWYFDINIYTNMKEG